MVGFWRISFSLFPMCAGSKSGLISAPRWPQAAQMNFGSRSDKRTRSGQRSALMMTEWAQLSSPQQTISRRGPSFDRISPRVIFFGCMAVTKARWLPNQQPATDCGVSPFASIRRKVRTGRRKLHAGSGFVQFQPIPCDGGPPIERAVWAITGRLFSTIADHGPAHCLNFGEAVKITRTPDRPLIVRVLCPARLTMRLTDKILSTTETED